MVVENLLNKLEIPYEKVILGKVEMESDLIDDEKLKIIRVELERLGFELIDSHKGKLIEQIKTIVIERIHFGNLEENNFSWSDLISDELHYDYKYLSRLFSSTESVTIEHYIINQKIEKAKELIAYDELTLSQIAYKLGYSSVAHLSGQFKKVTGMTPSEFKKLGTSLRKPLDEV
jgi:AraC-like DNA-binding protein